MEKELNESEFEDLRKPRRLSETSRESFGSCVSRVTADLSAEGMNPETAEKVARQRCSALKSAGYVEDEIKKNDDLSSEFLIGERQIAFMHSLLHINKSLGKWDQGLGSDGAHYIFQSDNEFSQQGIACHNCIFFIEPASCNIVRGIIQHDGVCKLWVIPESVIDPNPSEEDEEESFSVDNSILLEDFEQVDSINKVEGDFFDSGNFVEILREGENIATGIKREKNKRNKETY
jgi:hypothetical protein